MTVQTAAPTCETCHQAIPKDPRESWAQYAKSRWCNSTCRSRGSVYHLRETRRRTEVLEEFEWLCRYYGMAEIAGKLGYKSAKGLARVLYRWGRPDLGRLVERDIRSQG